MKDYSLDEESKKRYIVNVRANRDKTFDVLFADGSELRGVEATSENYLKVKRVLEEQAKMGLDNYSRFEGQKNKHTVLAAIKALGLTAAGVGVCSIPQVGDIILKEPPVAAICGVCAVTVLGTMPSIVKAVKNSSKVKELDKIKYRNDHRRELESISRYPNSLNGINSNLRHIIREEDDPFSMLNVDDYSMDDLEKIVDNVLKEEDFQFTYKLSPRKKARK